MALSLEGSEHDVLVLQDVDLVKDGDPDVSFTIRRLSVPKVREIYRRHTKKANARRDGEVDLPAVVDDELDYVLVAWTGIVGKDQQPLPCERIYKLGDLSQGLLGLPSDRRSALLKIAQDAAQTQEDAKQESFRTAS